MTTIVNMESGGVLLKLDKHDYNATGCYAHGRNGPFDPREVEVWRSDEEKRIRLAVFSARGSQAAPLSLSLPIEEMRDLALSLLRACGGPDNPGAYITRQDLEHACSPLDDVEAAVELQKVYDYLSQSVAGEEADLKALNAGIEVVKLVANSIAKQS